MADSRLVVGRILARRYVVGELSRQTELVSTHRGFDVKAGFDIEIECARAGVRDVDAVSGRLRAAARDRSRITHPHISRPYDIGELADGRPFIVTKAPVGTTLREQVLRHGPLPPDDAVRLAKNILSALSHAHREDIAHGALSPDVVLVTVDSGTLRLTSIRDLGSGELVPDYAAPEIARGEEPDVPGDLYACGGVLFFAATGHAPSAAGAFPLPASLARVIVRSRHVDPASRHATAGRMLRALDGQDASCEDFATESMIVPTDRSLVDDAAEDDPGYREVLTGPHRHSR